MPITYTIDASRHRLIFTLSGTLTAPEMLGAVDEVLRAAGPGHYHVLSDHRALDTPATTPQLEGLVAHLAKYHDYFGGSCWAIVVGRPASYGMMRMLSVMAERIPIQVEIFTELPEAERWLDAPPAG